MWVSYRSNKSTVPVKEEASQSSSSNPCSSICVIFNQENNGWSIPKRNKEGKLAGNFQPCSPPPGKQITENRKRGTQTRVIFGQKLVEEIRRVGSSSTQASLHARNQLNTDCKISHMVKETRLTFFFFVAKDRKVKQGIAKEGIFLTGQSPSSFSCVFGCLIPFFFIYLFASECYAI